VHPQVTAELLRAPLFHTPRNPFYEDGALVCHEDGGLLIRDGRIADCGDYSSLRARNPEAAVIDLRGGFLLPGLVDAHVHFPQLRVLGSWGRSLLDWLEHCALPEEARMSDAAYAAGTAREFVHALVSHGTTTAMVFGAHFSGATAALFEAAEVSGLRIAAGLVLSDRLLRPDLHIDANAAYAQSSELIRKFHKRGRLLYAVTPRFALSASEAILEVCKTLRTEHPDLRFQTHLNENHAEIAEVRRLSPWAQDYFEIYERFGLCGRGAVMAHNVHPMDRELDRLSATSTTIAHCPASSAALGSGTFPMHRHLRARVPFALGTDVGGGTGFGILKEGLQAYLMQRVAAEPVILDGARLLYLATKAGASALALDHETGDFEPGKSADFVYLRPRAQTPLAAVIDQAATPERILTALFTLAGAETIRQVRVAGSIVYENDD
jgi:guanine deaminase